MQLCSILVLALAVASGFAVPISKDDDRMKNLLNAVSEFVKAQSAKLKPLQIPDIHQDTSNIPVLSNLINSVTTMRNNTYIGFNYSVFEDIHTYSGHLIGQMCIRHPKIVLSGEYELEGTVLGFEMAKGAGHYSLEYINATNHLTNIMLFENEKKALRVASFGARFDLEDVQLDISGLNIHGMSTSTFEKLGEFAVHKMYNDNKRTISKTWEATAIVHLNHLIGNRTLEQVIDYLNKEKDSDIPQEHLTPLLLV